MCALGSDRVEDAKFLVPGRPLVPAAALLQERHRHLVGGRRLVEQPVGELPHAAAVGFALLDSDDVRVGRDAVGSRLEHLAVERELLRVSVLAGVPLEEGKVVARLEVDDDRPALEVGVEPVHPDLARLSVEGDADRPLGASVFEERVGDGVQGDALLELQHPAEVLAGDDGALLRRQPLAVSLGGLAERLAGLGVRRPRADEVLGVELRPSFEDERVQGASRLVRSRVRRLDLAGHLLPVQARTRPEVAEQMARQELAAPCGLVVLVGRNVDDEWVAMHGVFLSFRADSPPRHPVLTKNYPCATTTFSRGFFLSTREGRNMI